MAGKKGGKKFSVDEYLAGYEKAPKHEAGSSIDEALERKRDELKRKADVEEYSRTAGSGTAGKKQVEEKAAHETEKKETVTEKKETVIEKKEVVAESEFERIEGVEDVIRNRPIILAMYAARAFAISLMVCLMLFLLSHNVIGSRAGVQFSSAVDFIVTFIASYVLQFIVIFAFLLGVQVAYYFAFRALAKKWKVCTRNEVTYSVVFSVLSLIASALVVYSLGLF